MTNIKETKEKIIDKLEGKKKRYGIGFTKTVHGMAIIEARNEEEAKERWEDGEIDDEYDNKCDYEYNEKDGEPIFEEMAN